MTDSLRSIDLDEIMARAKAVSWPPDVGLDRSGALLQLVATDVPALCAEVVRLRDALEDS